MLAFNRFWHFLADDISWEGTNICLLDCFTAVTVFVVRTRTYFFIMLWCWKGTFTFFLSFIDVNQCWKGINVSIYEGINISVKWSISK